MDVERMLKKASDEAKRKNFDYAIRLFREILALRPDATEARKGLRQTALKKHARKYPSALAARTKGAGALASIRMQKLAKQHLALLDTCEKYLQHDPKNLQVLVTLAEAAEAAGHPDTAIQAWEDVIEFHPEHMAAFKKLGTLYHERNRPEEALAAYEKALAVSPKDADIIKARKNLAAESAIRSSGIDRANSSRELARDKDELERLEAGKRILKGPKELEASIRRVEGLLKENPDDLKAMRELAELYNQKGDVDEAIEVLEESLEVSDTEELRTRIGDLKIRRARDRVLALESEGNEDALQAARSEDLKVRSVEYHRRVQARPTDLRSRFLLGTASLEGGDIDEAIGEFQQTVKDPKHRLDSLVKLGDCFFRKKMYDLAAKQLREALGAGAGTGSRELEIWYTLGVVHEEGGDIEAAREAFSRVYEKDIRYRDVADRLQSMGGVAES